MSRFIQAKDGNGHTISMTLSDGDIAVLELFRNKKSGDTKLSISAVSMDGDTIHITVPDRNNKNHVRIYDLKKSEIL